MQEVCAHQAAADVHPRGQAAATWAHVCCLIDCGPLSMQGEAQLYVPEHYTILFNTLAAVALAGVE